jgi:hypothetical protein
VRIHGRPNQRLYRTTRTEVAYVLERRIDARNDFFAVPLDESSDEGIRPAANGAKTSLFAATAPDLPGGSYVVPNGLLQLYGEPALRRKESALRHESAMRALWDRSEELTGIRYQFTSAPP